jgi:hypothetical protein
MSHEPMHTVIRLKRYEQPPAGYFDDFLREFHHRQRAELLKPSLSTLITERLSYYFSELRVPTMAFAAAAVVALVASVAILRNPVQSEAPRNFAAAYEQVPVTIPKMQPVSLRLDAPANSTPALFSPATMMLRARQANHESPISF